MDAKQPLKWKNDINVFLLSKEVVDIAMYHTV